MPPPLTDLIEVKQLFGIDPDNETEDTTLLLAIDQASSWIEEIVHRPIFKEERTEYYNGTGTNRLLLRSRPVFTSPTIQVFENEDGYFGAPTDAFDSTSELTYGDDFALKIDQPDGTSRSGILIRIGRAWRKPFIREAGWIAPYVGRGFGSIKVIYTAGYTVDTLPPVFRMAANQLVGRIRALWIEAGLPLSSESYQGRSVSYVQSAMEGKHQLTSLTRSMLQTYVNWSF